MAAAPTAEQLRRLPEGIDLLAGPSTAVRLVDQGAGTAIALLPEAPLDLAVVWTDPPRPMVCLEPWTGPRGSLASGDRCLWLQPGERQQLRCRYQLIQL
jgi:galactose mutarotase-like enzyme